MGLDLYILARGETVEELERRESADHFGLRNKAMSELGKLTEEAGTGLIVGGEDEPIPPEAAAEIAHKLRSYLAETEPGPPGSPTDEEMRGIASDFASFCERASEEAGYVTW
jgi:hypothetical protein